MPKLLKVLRWGVIGATYAIFGVGVAGGILFIFLLLSGFFTPLMRQGLPPILGG